MAQVRVYATTYIQGDPADNTTHDLGWFPDTPRQGEVLHYSTTDDEDDSLAWHVDRVSWCPGTKHFGTVGQWHVELAVSA